MASLRSELEKSQRCLVSSSFPFGTSLWKTNIGAETMRSDT